MNPQVSVGVFSQRDFRGAGGGPLDDCWTMADQMSVHGCAPWKPIYDIRQYRAAAGVPDTDAASEGGSLEASHRALTALHPDLRVELFRGTFTAFLDKAKQGGRMVSASVWSRALGYATDFTHRVAFYWNGATWRMLDPLKPAFSNASDTSTTFENAGLTAMLQHPDPAEANCLIFPTADEAFATHPLAAAILAQVKAIAAQSHGLDLALNQLVATAAPLG